MNPISLLENLINEHGSSVILRERLLLLKDELGKIEKERAELQAEVSNLIRELANLRKEMQEKAVPDEYVEHIGALFKRNPSGGYAPCAYCPKCKTALWNNDPDIFPYECSSCGYQVMIHEKLASIVENLK